MLAVDALVAVVTWSPYYIWLIVNSHDTSDGSIFIPHQQRSYVILMFTILSIINCFITPIIYLISNKSYKVI